MYRIKLNEFEGPLDLLLFFIQRDELDIHNIPISKITNEFCEYVNYMQVLDLEVASEFILMAATLIQIKAKMMLYRPDDEIEEEEDPRYELVKQLLEYKRFKDASAEFAMLEEQQRKVFFRNDFDGDYRIDESIEEDLSIQNLTLYNLIKAYKFAMDHQPKEVVHNIMRMNVSIDEQIEYVNEKCSLNEYVSFLELIIGMEKIRVVVTFIAILEMAKNGIVGIKINETLTDFHIFKTAELPEEGIIETSSFN
ncbi:MAG: segregation/condensation protein A [Ignavibacteria bacterium]|nr:segregation/condensation protein A [Ignavibacteria bacterium]MCC7158452.1 segregation/condensation protein A [Ignavibacteria bacterium]